jgi:hypothetical protein
VCLLGLSACSVVVSTEPWFTEADAQPVPAFRDGLWVSAEPECRFDETRPAERWPGCASASFVRGNEHWSMQWNDVDHRGRRRRTFAGWELHGPPPGALFVANGDHLIVQFQAEEEAAAASPDETDTAGEEQDSLAYMYVALRPLRRDENGKLTATEMWSVQCGPLPEKRPSQGRRHRSDDDQPALTEGNVTDRPFAGLTVGENVCTAESVSALRNAAVLSEALQPPTQQRWVREGWH